MCPRHGGEGGSLGGGSGGSFERGVHGGQYGLHNMLKEGSGCEDVRGIGCG